MNRNYLLAGEPLRPEPVPLRVGDFEAEFEPNSGWIRYIRYQGREVMRALYAAVRDPQWGTPPVTISNLSIEQTSEDFAISFEASVEPTLPFRWKGTVQGDGMGISYSMEGCALGDLETNRAGICVLHPASMKGEPCVVGHPGGVEENTKFPSAIDPDSPFLNVETLSYPGCFVTLEGDVFETEDQRNWTDASFKTFSRPLDLPRPFALAEGQRVNQEVSLEFSSAAWGGRHRATSRPLPPLGILDPESSDIPLVHVAHRGSDGIRLGDLSVHSHPNFADLNRNRPVDAEHVMFAVNPQSHARDWKTVIESLETLGDTVATARQFASHVHVGPVTLNAADDDPRWTSFLAAGWVLGVVGMLTEAGAASITFSRRADEYPVRLVLEDMAPLEGQAVEVDCPTHPATTIRLDFEAFTLVANLTTAPKTVANLPPGRLRMISEANYLGLNPTKFDGGMLELPPGAYARIER